MSDHQSNNNNNQHQPPNSTTAVARACPIESTASSIPQINNEIPFLVTHYLRHYNNNSSNNNGGTSSNIDPAAVERIHELSKELSDLFTSIGAFGTSIGNDSSRQNSSSSLITTPSSQPSQQPHPALRNATYNDILRRWPHLPPSQLPNILLSSVSIATSTAASKRPDPHSILDAAHESTANDGQSTDSSLPSLPLTLSLLQPPILLSPPPSTSTPQPTTTPTSSSTHLPTHLGSDLTHHLLTAVHHSRLHLENRILLSNSQSHLHSIQQSLSHNYTQRSLLPPIPHSTIIDVDEDPNLQALRQRHHDISRVVSQLERQLSQHTITHTSLYHQTQLSNQSATHTLHTATTLHNSFRDPTTTPSSLLLFSPSSRLHTPTPLSTGGFLSPTSQKNRRPTLWYTLQSRHCGLTIPLHRPATFGTPPFSTPYKREAMIRPLITTRLRHSVTINCHLTYPVYCLRFDRSGRYFATGADDHLVKLFMLRRGGAVLVCTLRGHAGVVTDVDVSSDNAMVASASEDGDCRIWGMKDGAPVAILRGHEGGANMVSWSLLTPYRIVTSAQDGLARVWDVRDAALKRYPRIISHRRDYRASSVVVASSHMEETDEEDVDNAVTAVEQEVAAAPPAADDPPPLEETISVPPLPPPPNANPLPAPPIIPPLPPGAEPAPIGNFTPGRLIDQGVHLLSQLPHGDIPTSDNNNGVGTRARRKAVKVMCVARCPMGGHFCTGSDDGMGRVWADEIDERIEMLDEELRETGVFGSHYLKQQKFVKKTSRRRVGSGISMASITPSKETLMAMLPGHLNAITDVQYSHLGDRILTASEKDGQVRIWKWDRDYDSAKKSASLVNLTQILIRLQPPQDATPSPTAQSTPSRRRRRGGSNRSSLSPPTVRCDVAVWTCDDSKIITSQSSPLPPSRAAAPGQPPLPSTEIVIGSNIIYVWNSHTGRCLLGITAAHELCCPVLAPHPHDPCLLASGGADGRLHVWDLNRGGVAIYSHKNTLTHGAMENDSVVTRRGKDCGYLDGCFSQDGWTLVMTDDHGRVTVVDTSEGCREKWMQEQYFANDYYDLFYDAHGYAIDRGSELPPHLAPRAVRCNHTASSASEEVNRLLANVSGPLPLGEDEVRWKREGIRATARDQRLKMIRLKQRKTKRCQMTVITGGTDHGAIVTRADRPSLDLKDDAARQQERIQQANQRRLNNNYRWIGYDEMNIYEVEDEEGDDDNDDAYEEEPRRLIEDEDDEEDIDETEFYDEEADSTPRQQRSSHRAASRRRRRRQNRRHRTTTTHTTSENTRSTRNERRTNSIAASLNQPTRISSRPHRPTRTYYDPGSSDSDDPFNEEISRVTEPTERMPHRDDYHLKGHFFKLPTNAAVNRAWVTRSESLSGHSGRKSYTPQVGDSVIYIPRAHYDSLHKFPTGDQTTAPWKTFPENSTWPVVRCSITSIRYRFPYANYYRCARGSPCCKSIVAIVELKVTGIPLEDGGGYPWATPRFVERGGGVGFEVSVFENEEVEFLCPESLYVWRLQSLEEALKKRARVQNREEGGEVELLAFFRDDADNREEEDFSLSPTDCRIVGYGDEVMRRYGVEGGGLTENIMSEIQVLKSGYNAIEVLWSEDPEDKSTMSTWEVTTKEAAERGMPPPPTIPTSEKHSLIQILDELESHPNVKEWFLTPVDTKRYSDYLQMIEVPMHLLFIRERLRNDYYTSTAGLEADIELIRLNCIKYNDDGEVVDAADELVSKFKRLLEKVKQRRQRSRSRGHSVDSEAMMTDGTGENDRNEHDDEDQKEEAAVHNTRSSARLASRTTEREVSSSDTHSSLASLPAPPPPAAAAARQSHRIESDNNNPPTRSSTRLSSRISSALRADNESSSGDQLTGLEDLAQSLHTTAAAATQIRISEESDDEPSPTRVTRASSAAVKSTALYSSEDDEDEDEDVNESEQEDLDNIDNDSFQEEEEDDDEFVDEAPKPSTTKEPSPSRPPASRRTRQSSTVDSNEERKPLAAAAAARIQTRRSAAAIQEPTSSDDDDDDDEHDDDVPLLTQHRSQTRRSAQSIQDPSSDDDDDPPPTPKKFPMTRQKTTSRRKPKAHDDDSDSYEEEDDLPSDDSENSRLGLDESSDHASVNSVQERRSVRTKPTTTTTTRATLMTRTSPRNKNRRKQRRGYDEDSDDEFNEDDFVSEDDDDELDEFVKTPPNRNKRRNNNARKKKPAARAPAKKKTAVTKKRKGGRPKAATKRKVYSDDDEEDDDEDNGQMSASSEEYKPPAKKRKAPNQRTKKGKPTEDHLYLPDVPVWPNVCRERDELVVLAHIIMEKMSAIDVEELFAEPVVMQYPDISDQYLARISTPMDFRTIREERIQDYIEINELQEDLILVFKNCCAYNGEGSKWWQYAVEKWRYLTDCFREACNEEGVQLPRRW